MQLELLATAGLLGLLGGPHCVAMCGAPVAGTIRLVREPAAGATLVFHAGRAASYGVAGAVVAAAVQSLALAGEHAALRPLWVLLHAGILAWGLALLVRGRQPAWAHTLGRAAAARLRPHIHSGLGLLVAGALWVLMPCGLLYSALAMASLANGVSTGAAAMLLFALGSAFSLACAPWLLWRLRAWGGGARGERVAGLLLVLLALQALWMDLERQLLSWCST
ncbi:MAG TPA: sulfite exporter TauE/SafE family protein [Variovorax sp.]|nr:sulfite exporter TauE/SafE family protein [Variovorax sp.]